LNVVPQMAMTYEFVGGLISLRQVATAQQKNWLAMAQDLGSLW